MRIGPTGEADFSGHFPTDLDRIYFMHKILDFKKAGLGPKLGTEQRWQKMQEFGVRWTWPKMLRIELYN